MDNSEFKKMSTKFIRLIKNLINTLVPQLTQDCIRSKAAKIISRNIQTNTYDIMLVSDIINYQLLNEDYEIFKKEYQEFKDKGTSQPNYEKLKEKYERENTNFEYKIEGCFLRDIPTIQENTIYKEEDLVTVGYLDNKLTNAFILFKNKKN